ncbi:MAG: four helix bundle protein [Pirellulaceae bacterium]|nr:four helix bundle protein [Pirellulaceae bacterium]
MAKIERFEDIEAWKRARELTRKIYACTKLREFSRDFGLKDQIRRASVSTMSNVGEGFERGGNQEFQQFLAIAKGSNGEVRSQLYVALDQGYISQERFNELYADAMSISRLIAGFIRYLQQSELRGSKFKRRSPTSDLEP